MKSTKSLKRTAAKKSRKASRVAAESGGAVRVRKAKKAVKAYTARTIGTYLRCATHGVAYPRGESCPLCT